MKNYVTTTLSDLAQLLLNESITLFTDGSGKKQSYRCFDKIAVQKMLVGLQNPYGLYMQPQSYPSPEWFANAPTNMQWMYPTQNPGQFGPYGHIQNQQFERVCFVCVLEHDPHTKGLYIRIFNEANPQNYHMLPVVVESEKPEDDSVNLNAYTGTYEGTFPDFCSGIQYAGVSLNTGEGVKSQFVGGGEAVNVSGMSALQAIYNAIRMVDGHRSVSSTQQKVDISTGRPSGYVLVYELLEGHRELKLFFKDHPGLSVTFTVRRIG